MIQPYLGGRGGKMCPLFCVFIGPESDHWESLSLTHWLIAFSKLDWCDPGVWRCLLKTCWGSYCCWCWWCWSCCNSFLQIWKLRFGHKASRTKLPIGKCLNAVTVYSTSHVISHQDRCQWAFHTKWPSGEMSKYANAVTVYRWYITDH